MLTQLTFTYSKSTIETLEKSAKYDKSNDINAVVFNVNFGHVSQQFLVFLLLNLNKQMLVRTLTCLITNESKVKISFNQLFCRSFLQVVDLYLTSTVRNNTQNKKYFLLSDFLSALQI